MFCSQPWDMVAILCRQNLPGKALERSEIFSYHLGKSADGSWMPSPLLRYFLILSSPSLSGLLRAKAAQVWACKFRRHRAINHWHFRHQESALSACFLLPNPVRFEGIKGIWSHDLFIYFSSFWTFKKSGKDGLWNILHIMKLSACLHKMAWLQKPVDWEEN